MANIAETKDEDIDCPFCKSAKIHITITSEYYSYHTSHISAKNQKIPVYHPERIEVHSKCPSCNASKQDIKEAVKRGSSGISHEERVKRLQNSGMPTHVVEVVPKHEDE